MRLLRVRVGVVALVGLTLLTGACASDDEGGGGGARTMVVGSAPFAESVILANMYAKALEAKGYTVQLKSGLGQREIYLPALEKGGRDNGIDLVPEYVGTLLEFVNKNAGEASGDLDKTVSKLRERLEPLGISALTPSPAADQNAFAVTRATADQYQLKKLSDVTRVAGDLTLGAGAECPTRPFCLPGLEKTYGLKFKGFRALDSCGPRTVEALANNDVQIGLVCSSQGAVAARDLVVLEDDKKLQTVDNIVPAIRKELATDEVTEVLNRISSELNTADLTLLNKRVEIDKEDPAVVAESWLRDHGLLTKS
jgi:osmoprotectant transport system substrate-binding protein